MSYFSELSAGGMTTKTKYTDRNGTTWEQFGGEWTQTPPVDTRTTYTSNDGTVWNLINGEWKSTPTDA